MLLDKFALTPTNNRNYKSFISLGYSFKIGKNLA